MNPRDISHRTALIIGSHEIEVADVADYLVSNGWQDPVIVTSPDGALALLEARTTPFALVVVMIAGSDPVAATIMRICKDEGCPVVVVDGARATVRAGQAVALSRPFTDTDLDQALRSLGLLPC